MEELIGVLRAFWPVWLMALFVGVVAWTLWPKRKRKLEEDYSHIPLRDDEPNEER